MVVARHAGIFWFTPLLLALLAVGTSFSGIGGPVYLTVALVLNALFLRGAWQISRRTEDDSEADNFKVERGFFKLSLALPLPAFWGDSGEALLKPYGLGGWS